MTPTWPQVLAALLSGQELSRDEAAWAMAEIMEGEATPVQVAGFAMALRAKGETAVEVAGLVESMLARAVRLPVSDALRDRAVDTCGTGGGRGPPLHNPPPPPPPGAAAGGAGVQQRDPAAPPPA